MTTRTFPYMKTVLGMGGVELAKGDTVRAIGKYGPVIGTITHIGTRGAVTIASEFATIIADASGVKLIY
jgi:hypothetical protein